MVTTYIGLGSNLEDPVRQIHLAIEALQSLAHSKLLAVSSLYRSAPMGVADQPDFINAVAGMATELDPFVLLEALHAIEQKQGRVRSTERWGPRTLDLDLLLYGDEIINSEQLTVPHRGLHERSFVLYPLHEIAPALEIPGSGALSQLITTCNGQGLERLTEHGI